MTDAALTRLARFVVEDPLTADSETLGILRDGVVDALGCIHAGAGTDVAAKAREAARAMGAEGFSAVIGTGMRVSRPQAAFLNAVAGHALDFDDWEIPGNTHPTVVMLPALLAVAEEETNGADLAKAYLAGFEVIARLGEALNFEHYDAGWHSTATLGAPGAAAACSRLMGLSATETANAMSLAISAASGYTCQFGTNAKPVQAGFASRAGVEAAFLARSGLTAQAHVLDHARGQAALMGGLSPNRLETALNKLGRGYALTEYGLVLKPWPSCGYTHRIMTCSLELRERAALDSISRIDLHLPDFHAAVLPFSQPATRAQALFSLPFVTAMGLTHGRLTVTDLDAHIWNDRDVAGLIEKISVHSFAPERPEANYSEDDPDRMIATLVDGRILEEVRAYPLGAPQAPMSEELIWGKFKANVGLISESRAGDSDWIGKLRDWPEERAIRTLFCGYGPIQ